MEQSIAGRPPWRSERAVGTMLVGMVLERARSSRSRCRFCGGTIAQGQLRIGRDGYTHSDGSVTSQHWHHVRCALECEPTLAEDAWIRGPEELTARRVEWPTSVETDPRPATPALLLSPSVATRARAMVALLSTMKRRWLGSPKRRYSLWRLDVDTRSFEGAALEKKMRGALAVSRVGEASDGGVYDRASLLRLKVSGFDTPLLWLAEAARSRSEVADAHERSLREQLTGAGFVGDTAPVVRSHGWEPEDVAAVSAALDEHLPDRHRATPSFEERALATIERLASEEDWRAVSIAASFAWESATAQEREAHGATIRAWQERAGAR
jgi:hypothetical protein